MHTLSFPRKPLRRHCVGAGSGPLTGPLCRRSRRGAATFTPTLSRREREETGGALRHGNLGLSGIHGPLVVDPLKAQAA